MNTIVPRQHSYKAHLSLAQRMGSQRIPEWNNEATRDCQKGYIEAQENAFKDLERGPSYICVHACVYVKMHARRYMIIITALGSCTVGVCISMQHAGATSENAAILKSSGTIRQNETLAEKAAAFLYYRTSPYY